MVEFSPSKSQWLLLVGIVMLACILVLRQIRSRRRMLTQNLSDRDLGLKRVEADRRRAIPLASAPVEVQRWQVEMFDLQRELKAELDMKIVVVQSLIRQADERISALRGRGE